MNLLRFQCYNGDWFDVWDWEVNNEGDERCCENEIFGEIVWYQSIDTIYQSIACLLFFVILIMSNDCMCVFLEKN